MRVLIIAIIFLIFQNIQAQDDWTQFAISSQTSMLNELIIIEINIILIFVIELGYSTPLNTLSTIGSHLSYPFIVHFILY